MKKKKKRVLPVILALIVAVIVILGVMVKWDSGYEQSISGNLDAYNKLQSAFISGEPVALTSDDVNSIIKNYYKVPQSYRGVTLKNIYINFKDDNMEVRIPVAYKGISFLLYSKGKLQVFGDDFLYTPASFKLGALPIPKSMVLNKLKALNNSNLKVQADAIAFDKSKLPVNINSAVVKDGKLNLTLEKFKLNLGSGQLSDLKDKLANILNGLKGDEKQRLQDVINYINNNAGNSNILSNVKNKLEAIPNTTVQQVAQNIKPPANSNSGSSNGSSSSSSGSKNVDKALASRVSGQLSAAEASVSDPSVKALIGSIIGQLNSGQVNSAATKAQYHALSKVQQAQFLAVIYAHVNMNDANTLRSQFFN